MNLALVNEYITPSTILDLGAHRGLWTAEAKKYWPDAKYILIEGNPANEEDLKATGEEYYIAVLSDCKKDTIFYSRQDDHQGTGDSLFREQTPWYSDDNVRQLRVWTSTLDEVMRGRESLGLPEFDRSHLLIKMDLQGGELGALLGGIFTVNEADSALIEVAVSSYNAGAPQAHEVDFFMQEWGFPTHIDLGEITHPLTQEVIQIDRLYLR